jgi:YHS domain-containing protein
MKKQILTVLFTAAASFLLLTACKNEPAKTEEKTPTDTVAMTQDTTSNAFDHLLVDNKKDPSCGMPTTAGIHDTAHYKDKVLGFCSKECKEAFQKEPEKLIAAAELKK